MEGGVVRGAWVVEFGKAGLGLVRGSIGIRLRYCW